MKNINYNFEDKLVIVTAGSKGIGYAIIKEFYDAGASIATCARNETLIKEIHNNFADKSRFFALSGDIKKLTFLKKFYNETSSYFKKNADILINNSGGPAAGAAEEMDDDIWLDALNGCLLSVIRMSNLAVPAMKKQKWGRIINLTSTTAREPAPGMALSNVTRAGVASYTKTISSELGPFGITANTILTGGCLTERFYSLVNRQMEQNGENLDEAMARLNKTLPVRHFSTPEEFSQYILFIASNEAKYLTGAAIPIDGGASKAIF